MVMGDKIKDVQFTPPSERNGQIKAANRVAEMVLRSILHECHELSHWKCELSIVDLLLIVTPHNSRGIRFFFNYIYHPATLIDILRDVEMTTKESVSGFSQRMQ